MLEAADKGRWRLSCRQPRPLHRPEDVRDKGFLVASAVYDYWHQERALDSHQVRAIYREFPLEPKVALEPLLCMVGDHRHEKSAVLYLAPDPLVPDVSAPELALVKPDLDAGRAEGRSDSRSSDGVLRRVA
jgi:hypothetical protein